VANELKATKHMALAEVMQPLADALDDWALVREKVLLKRDLVAATEARSLAGEIRFCLEQLELADSMADGEAATRRLQQLRTNSIEFLARKT
jgi:hypothetical protein